MGNMVGYWGTFSTPASPGNGTFTSTAWFNASLAPNRLYYISCTPIQVNNSAAFANEEITTRWVVSDTDGRGPTTYAQTSQTVPNSPGVAALAQGFLYGYAASGSFETNTTTFELQSRGSAGTLSFTNVGGWNLYCFDLGPGSAGINQGGLGAASGATQRIDLYPATDSQTYDGNGDPLGGNGEAWRGTFPAPEDTYGNTRSIICFDGGQIRSDLSGATVQEAWLHLYCLDAEETLGSLGFDYLTDTSPPSTLGPGSVEYAFDDDFPKGQYTRVDILGGFLDDILNNNANSMHLCSTLLGLAATKFSGYANESRRPYLEIKYTK